MAHKIFFGCPRARLSIRRAFNTDIDAVKNFFHKPLYKRRARTGIKQK
jgi:hypothetical protein